MYCIKLKHSKEMWSRKWEVRSRIWKVTTIISEKQNDDMDTKILVYLEEVGSV